jgi:hypothetical protein
MLPQWLIPLPGVPGRPNPGGIFHDNRKPFVFNVFKAEAEKHDIQLIFDARTIRVVG